MKINGFLISVIMICLLIGLVSAWTPADNVDLQNWYNMTNLNYFDGLTMKGNLTMDHDVWIRGIDNAATAYVNMFKVNDDDEIQVGGTLVAGNYNFVEDSGVVTFVNMPVSAASSDGDEMSYSFMVDSNNILKIYSEADGNGGADNFQIILSGNLNASGYNATADNIWIPSYLSTHTNSTIAIASAGVWYNVTFDVHDDTIKQGITHTYNDATNDTFIIIDTGIYEVDYGLSYIDSAANPTNHVAIRLIKNGEVANLTAGDEIKLQFISSSTTVSIKTESTYGGHPTSANINIYRIG